jgi:DNA primase
MKRSVSFVAIKNAVTMEHALARYGILLKPAGFDTIRGQCPLPMHESDSVYSFSVDTRRNIWACHSESCIRNRGGGVGGNVLDFIALMERCSIREAALLLQDGSIELPSAPATQGARPSGGDRRNVPLTFQLTELLGQHPYLVARGVDEATAALFGIGYYRGRGFLRGRIAIPIHNAAGELVAYASRSVDSSEPKYLFPPGFRKSAELFNLHRVSSNTSQQLIVVEGFFDCVRVHQSGFSNVVALMGCTMSREQTKLLCAVCSRVVLFLDGDSAGRQALSAISSTLAARGLEVRKVCLSDGWQPDKMSTHDVQRLLGDSTECKYIEEEAGP